jgi:hypothetical protein
LRTMVFPMRYLASSAVSLGKLARDSRWIS